jgi:dihydroorotase
MKTSIINARILDPHLKIDQIGEVHLEQGHIKALGPLSETFKADHVIDAKGLWLIPGLVDLSARVMEPGHEHEGMLASELYAAAAGGVTSMVCPPDTDPVLDEPGLVEMLQFRASNFHLARLYPLGALTCALEGQKLTEMGALTQAGCIGFGQAEMSIKDTHVLNRALSYASTFGYSVWLHPKDAYLGGGVAASGALALRMGLSAVPTASETIALNTIFALMKSTGARVHLSRLSSALGVEMVRVAKAEGLPITCDVSINSLHLTEVDMGYFDSRARLAPPLRGERDRAALREGLAQGVIDALVSDHHPVSGDLKALPFAQAQPGATGLELLLSLALKWQQDMGISILDGLSVVTSRPGAILCAQSPVQSHLQPGTLMVGTAADFCLFDPQVHWQVVPELLHSQGKHTPFDVDLTGMQLQGQVKSTWVQGRCVFERES